MKKLVLVSMCLFLITVAEAQAAEDGPTVAGTVIQRKLAENLSDLFENAGAGVQQDVEGHNELVYTRIAYGVQCSPTLHVCSFSVMPGDVQRGAQPPRPNPALFKSGKVEGSLADSLVDLLTQQEIDVRKDLNVGLAKDGKVEALSLSLKLNLSWNTATFMVVR